MELSKLLQGKMVFLDTAPLIYFIEKSSRYLDTVKSVIALIDSRQAKGMTSTITHVGGFGSSFARREQKTG